GTFAGLSGTSSNAVITNGASDAAATLTVYNGSDNTFAGKIQNGTGTGAVSFVKGGAGTLTLSGANNYSGSTSLFGGKTVVSGSLSATSSVLVAKGAELNLTATGLVNQGATITLNGQLSGSGSVGSLNVGDTGVVSPGNDGAFGTLSTGDFTLTSTSQVNFDLSASSHATGGGMNDLIAVIGNLTLDGQININVIGGNLTAGTYALFTYTGSLTTDPTLSLSSSFLSEYAGASLKYGNGNEVDLLIVPEPSTWAMLVGGFGMLVGMQKMRNRNRG
ncbi:MAG: autotransporter-associated beta strand repeat-containing protein, partial [Chthoniobacteraceae bacterium]|nr:autotransporter-associated beta strand repeat-containing protein [Chthoniobacteraceae bacterium]